MTVRFELDELNDAASLLELVEDAHDAVIVTVDGRERFAAMPFDSYEDLKMQASGRGPVTPEARAESSMEGAIVPENELPESPRPDGSPADESACGGISAVPYVVAELPNTPIDSEDYQRSMWHDAIVDRMRKVMEVEAPIEQQRLFNAVRGSFGIKRSGRDVQHQNEWLFNRHVECRKTEFNGTTFLWLPDQDPSAYREYRVIDEGSTRQVTEIPYEELVCAIESALARNGALSRDELIEASMRLLGYKRKTNRVREVLGAAIGQSTDEGRIRIFTDGTFQLNRAA